MSLLQAILLGLIQGLTEFIPISSTAHLTLAGKLLSALDPQNPLIDPQHPDQWTAFIAVLQLGTLGAVVIYFWTDILGIVTGFVRTNFGWATGRPADESQRHQSRLGWLIFVGTLPVAIVGLVFRDQIEGKLTKNLWVIAGSLIGLALVLTIAELVGRRQRGMDQLSITDAVIVGIAQSLALIPGSSRSGTTITGGLFAGLERETAARFSFLLSIPAVAASGLFELPKAMSSLNVGLTSLAVATIAAAVSGYLTIAFLLKYLARHTTFVFVAYRLVLGLVLVYLLAGARVDP